MHSTLSAPRRVVALCASAGGLEPLLAVLRSVAPPSGCTFLVVQHMSPDQPSLLPQLLQAATAMPVAAAVDGLPLVADQVHVIAPGTLLTLERLPPVAVDPDAAAPAALPAQERLRVAPLDRTPGANGHQGDALLDALARVCGPRGVGVVLSGMGSDGSQGLRALIDRGGLAIAQTPASAQFGAMPRSAAAIGPVVQLASPQQVMPLILAALAGRPALPPLPPGLPLDHAQAQARVLRQLALSVGHDFSQYKVSTLDRRIARRMAMHGLSRLDLYAQLLADSSQEAELLFKELLIGVTRFFRDPPVWQRLAEAVLPDLLARAALRPERRLRCWVVGCSTGEEAYTLAMLLIEAQDAVPAAQRVALQIFATDLSLDAVQIARRGLYPAAIAASLTPARLARFFVAEAGGYRAAQALRETLLFAAHDVTSDAPFSQLDLLSCRNLLIYFKPPLQHRMLALFHYVLRPGGLLLLGSAETAGPMEPLFPALDPKLRILQRGQARLAGAAVVFPVKPFSRPATMSDASADHPQATEAPTAAQLPALQGLADRLMLEEFTPAAVLVRPDGDILYISGRTGRFLEPAAGKANWNLHAMARPGLRAALAGALQELRASGKPSLLPGLTVDPEAGALAVDLLVRPVQLGDHGKLALVVFREVPLPAPGSARRRGGRSAELPRALAESQALREAMQALQQERQSAIEELQSSNEELQSANEELMTSKEEMQAMNEELQTVNTELRAKLDDLALAQGDLKNLLNSTQIATVFLDNAMNVRRFTEQAKRVVKLREGDVGRPLSDLTTTLDYPDLAEDVAEVLRTLAFREREVQSLDGRWYAVRIMPYRTLDNVIDGSVITFGDITLAKALEARLRAAGAEPQAAG